MGRLDEALRQAASKASAGVPLPTASADDRIFESPWAVSPAESTEVMREHRSQAGGEEAGPRFPTFRSEWGNRLVSCRTADPVLVKQFSRLAGSLYNAQTAGQMKVVMMASVGTAEGKTLTALNLALVLSGSYGRRVLLIDGDLRRPSIHHVCGFGPLPGLSEALESCEPRKLPIVQIADTLWLLPAGQPNPDPMDRLISGDLRDLINQAAARFDWVILDAPPIGVVPDASVLAGVVDRVLFVVRARETSFPAVIKALDAIGRDRIFGVVLNGVTDVADSLDYSPLLPAKSV